MSVNTLHIWHKMCFYVYLTLFYILETELSCGIKCPVKLLHFGVGSPAKMHFGEGSLIC